MLSDPAPRLHLSEATAADAGNASLTAPAHPNTEPLMVRATAAARLCGVSEATWHRLRAAHQTPAPLRLGGSILWRVSDLKLFVEWGCPNRKEFEARLQAERGRR
jgi:predicted DNA-binding transcriptional regulator AlpA